MKKIKFFILSLISMLITSCGNGTTPTTSQQEFNNSWQEPAKSVLANSLGEYTIPYFEAETVYAQNVEQTGVTLAVLNLFDETKIKSNEVETIYALTLKEEGYIITDATEEEGCIYGVKEVKTGELAVVIQFAYIEEFDKVSMSLYRYLAIVTYLYQAIVNPTYESWPTQEYMEFFGCNIPSYDEAELYEVVYDINIDNLPTIDVYCYNAKDNAVEVYTETLINEGYIIESFNDLYFALNETVGLEIMFMMSYDNIFLIRAYNA